MKQALTWTGILIVSTAALVRVAGRTNSNHRMKLGSGSSDTSSRTRGKKGAAEKKKEAAEAKKAAAAEARAAKVAMVEEARRQKKEASRLKKEEAKRKQEAKAEERTRVKQEAQAKKQASCTCIFQLEHLCKTIKTLR